MPGYQRLSGLDASFLYLENTSQPLHVCSILELDTTSIPGGYTFDVAHTSLLKRAIRTLWLTLDEMDRTWLPVIKDYRLNERHYGGLTGLDKAQTAEESTMKQMLAQRHAQPLG